MWMVVQEAAEFRRQEGVKHRREMISAMQRPFSFQMRDEVCVCVCGQACGQQSMCLRVILSVRVQCAVVVSTQSKPIFRRAWETGICFNGCGGTGTESREVGDGILCFYDVSVHRMCAQMSFLQIVAYVCGLLLIHLHAVYILHRHT